MNIISVWLQTIKPWLLFLDSRKVFLIIRLIVYNDFTIKYHSTNSTGHTDPLSRHECAPEDTVVSAVSMEPSITSLTTTTVRTLLVTSQKEAMPKVIRYHRTQNIFRQTVSIFLPSAIINDYILFRERITVSLSLQNRVIKQFDFGHGGISHMKDLACSYIY